MLRRITRGAGRRASERILETVKSRLEVAAAVSRERLIEAHVLQALEMVELAGGRVPVARAVEIYARLHRLTPELTEIVRTRSLAALGQDASLVDVELDEPETAEAEEDSRPWVMLLLGERFRPRVHLELRRWMELHSGRAEVVLLEAHVQNALRFVEILSGEMSYPEAINTYIETLSVAPPSSQMVMFFTLERLSREHLPPGITGYVRGVGASRPTPASPGERQPGEEHQPTRNGVNGGAARPNGKRSAATRPLYRNGLAERHAVEPSESPATE
ncbi:MAG: hypothetical protein ACRELD_03210 [Longimicrobiales bacterium]